MTDETVTQLTRVLNYLQSAGLWEHLTVGQILALTPDTIQEIAGIALNHFTDTEPCPDDDSQLPELWYDIIRITL